jgi:hypothetical protein
VVVVQDRGEFQRCGSRHRGSALEDPERKITMNLKNLTTAVIIGLFYETVLHVYAIFFNIDNIHRITSLLTFLFGLAVLAFFIAFYRKERSNKNIKGLMEILIGFYVLSLILMFPISRNMINFRLFRLLQMVVRLINVSLFFTLTISIGKIIDPDHKLFRQAATLLALMLGINILKHLFALITYTGFIVTGVPYNPSKLLLNCVLLLFFSTHFSMIYFLYRYFKNNLSLINKH